MADYQTFRKLRSHPLLGSLPNRAIRDLAPKADTIRLAPGDILFEQGDPANAVYLISSGELEALAVDPRTGKPRDRGRYFGEDSIGDLEVLEATPYRASVRAVKPSELVRIPATAFRRLVGAYPGLRDLFLARTKAQPPEGGIFFSFPDLRPDERIITQQRKHWIVPLRTLSVPLLLSILVTAAVGWLIVAGPTGFRNYAQSSFVVLAVWAIIVLILIGWFLWKLIDWLNDYYIVTTHRVIHIEKVAFFFEERREAPIEKIQDVSLQLENPLEQILDYGHLTISTASREGQVRFRYVTDPKDLQHIILSRKEQFESQMRQREQHEKRRALERALGYDVAPEEPEDLHEEPTPADRVLDPWFDRLLVYLNPLNLREERPDGTILWRKHWVVLIGRIFGAFLFTLLWIAGFIIGLVAIENGALSPLLFSIVAFPTLLIALVWLYWVYEDWRNDVYVLTQDAVVDEERLPLGFETTIRRAPLDTVQDISYEIPNPLYTILNVGDVLIQTASAEGRLTFDNVAQPREVAREIYERLRVREEANRARQEKQRDQAIAEMLALYDRIREQEF